jgi:hypothetical protein
MARIPSSVVVELMFLCGVHNLRNTILGATISAEMRFLDDLHKKIDITSKVSNHYCISIEPRHLNIFSLDVVHVLDDE